MQTEDSGIVRSKGYLAPFAVAFVVCAAAFVLLDVAVMNMQGLSLLFDR